jgi:phage-related protein
MTAPVLSETLGCKITINSKKTSTYRLVDAQYGMGYRQVTPEGLNHITDKWSLEFAPLDGALLQELETFIALVGCNVWFTWTPLTETVPKKWRIDKDTIERNFISKTKWVVTFKITQCFDLGT